MLPFGRLRYDTRDNAVGYAIHNSRSHDAVIPVYDDAGNVIETHEHAGDLQRMVKFYEIKSSANSLIALSSSTNAAAHTEQ